MIFFYYKLWNMFFPVKIVRFGRPQTNFSGFKKWQAKERKKEKKRKEKKISIHFHAFSLPFSISPHLSFQIFILFLSIFPFFLTPFSPGWSAKISRWKMSGGTLPLPPPAWWCWPGMLITMNMIMLRTMIDDIMNMIQFKINTTDSIYDSINYYDS